MEEVDKMNKLKEKQKNETKNMIFNIALEYFKNEGYENTSIQSICTTCGIAKGTFYNYFNSKEDIIRESFRNGIDEFLLKGMENVEIHNSPVEALRDFIHLSLSYCNKVGKKTTSLAYICNLNSAINENMLYDAHFEILKQIISAGINKKIWKSNLHSSEYIELVTAFINGLMISFCFSVEEYDAVERNRAIINAFIQNL